ncbi:MAG: peptidase M22 [Clostridia bacterium]|nr:peptidase M22 [Clostridia bacterium]
MAFLGFDTSNYTTSAALYFPEENKIIHKKMLLPVKAGEKGLRQSDAVFHHVQQLHSVCEMLFADCELNIESIGASAFPRMAEGSYMPCFLVGLNSAKIISSLNSIKLHISSHQIGHILAALYGADRLELINERFIAFHLSGGTTEALLVEPDEKEIIKCTVIGESSDLKAGQAIDRVGVMLGMNFPCGAELDKLSQISHENYKIRPSVKGTDISLSGLENKCKGMFESGNKHCDIAKYCIQYICASVEKMTENIISRYGKLPIVYSGGVMSNTYMKKHLTDKFDGIFAPLEFSGDNAAGIAIMACLKEKKINVNNFNCQSD